MTSLRARTFVVTRRVHSWELRVLFLWFVLPVLSSTLPPARSQARKPRPAAVDVGRMRVRIRTWCRLCRVTAVPPTQCDPFLFYLFNQIRSVRCNIPYLEASRHRFVRAARSHFRGQPFAYIDTIKKHPGLRRAHCLPNRRPPHSLFSIRRPWPLKKTERSLRVKSPPARTDLTR